MVIIQVNSLPISGVLQVCLNVNVRLTEVHNNQWVTKSEPCAVSVCFSEEDKFKNLFSDLFSVNVNVVFTTLFPAIDGRVFSGTKGTNYKQKIKPCCYVSTSKLAYTTECFIHRHQSH